MPAGEVRGFVEQSIAASGTAADDLARLVAGGGLSPADFSLLARQEIKEEYLRQYLLGRGGLAQMKPADYGSIGGMLKEQYKYFNQFAKDIADGKLSEEQIAARMRMYTNSSREAYERAHQRNAKDVGMDEESWELGAAEHCDDCVELNGEGWQPIGHFQFLPGSGHTQCLTNCQCEIAYRNSKTEETYD
jgi:hypothetical protein